jgi:hypothetical protein
MVSNVKDASINNISPSGFDFIVVTDENHGSGSILYNIPATNGTYIDCTTITYVSPDLDEDLIILLVLFFFIIISTICAITVHEAFFGLNALLTALIFTVFIVYDYPEILLYASLFIIIAFSVMWVIIQRAKR